MTSRCKALTAGMAAALCLTAPLLPEDARAASQPASLLPRLPLFYTEWSASYTPADPIHDNYVEAAYILDKVKNGGQPALDVAAFVAPAGTLTDHVKPVAGAAPLTFRTDGLGKPGDVTLIPLYRLNHQRYNLYWSVYTSEEFARHQAAVTPRPPQKSDRETGPS